MTNAKLIDIEKLTSNIFRLRFTKPFTEKYQAGEFIQLTINHDNPDDRGNKRWFTLTSISDDDFLEITTRFFEKDSSTFKKAMFNLSSNDEVHISNTMGDFVLPKDKKLKLLFVAGGIGITPFYSILKQLENDSEKRSISLIWKSKNKEDKIDLPNNDSIDVLSYYDEDKNEFSTDTIFDKYRDGEFDKIYISGPEPMVESFTEELKKLGVKPHNIYSDYFPGYN